MLRGVMECNGKKAYFDFNDPWDKIQKVLHRIHPNCHLFNVFTNQSIVQIHITKFSNEIYKKISELSKDDHNFYNVYQVCKIMKHGDKKYHDYFIQHDFKNLQEVILHYDNEWCRLENNMVVDKNGYKSPDIYHMNFDPIKINGINVLFTEQRISLSKIPKGVYRYEVRHDEKGNMCQLGLGVIVNHYGTILSNKEIALDESGYYDFDENEDVEYQLRPPMNLKEYLFEKGKTIKQER